MPQDNFTFMPLVIALWGDNWRDEVDDLLRKHGHRYTRQTFYNWQHEKYPVPRPVQIILIKEAKRKLTAEVWKALENRKQEQHP